MAERKRRGQEERQQREGEGGEKGGGIWTGDEKMYSGKKRGIVGRQGMGEDTALHPQSSVRLHKYWVHGRVAGSQVNMTYEYCRSHSLASCPPQLLTSGSGLAQLLLEAFLSNTPENE